MWLIRLDMDGRDILCEHLGRRHPIRTCLPELGGCCLHEVVAAIKGVIDSHFDPPQAGRSPPNLLAPMQTYKPVNYPMTAAASPGDELRWDHGFGSWLAEILALFLAPLSEDSFHTCLWS
jgi:hypothetical protein